MKEIEDKERQLKEAFWMISNGRREELENGTRLGHVLGDLQAIAEASLKERWLDILLNVYTWSGSQSEDRQATIALREATRKLKNQLIDRIFCSHPSGTGYVSTGHDVEQKIHAVARWLSKRP